MQFLLQPIVTKPVHAKPHTVATLVGYRPQTSSGTVTVRHQLEQRGKGMYLTEQQLNLVTNLELMLIVH